jgi:hypothetical protein
MGWKEGEKKGCIDPKQSSRQLTVYVFGDLNPASVVVQTLIHPLHCVTTAVPIKQKRQNKAYSFFQQ